ncbi:MAG: RNA polymerase sigma factor [Ignavibacteria bacterium]|nr:RNA polymerase sigma factor [Ignavibacteria bacterium]
MDTVNIGKNHELELLFQKIVRGDRQAFDEFYDAIKKPLFAYCLAILQDEEEARDAFHTTVLKVYEARQSYREGNVHAWIFAIARNTSRSAVRRRRYSVTMADDFEVTAEESVGLAADETEIVQQAIRKLPEEFRQVVLLKYFGELSVETIAQSEGISVDLVKTRLFRARKRLAEILGTTFESQNERT